MKHRLRPQRSVSLLQGIMRIAMISKNKVIVVCTPLTVVSRSSLMSLIITFMFEPAKLQMNWASARGRISLREEATGRSGVRSWLAATGLSVRRYHHPNRVSVTRPRHRTESSFVDAALKPLPIRGRLGR
jgi:hypothetical protein